MKASCEGYSSTQKPLVDLSAAASRRISGSVRASSGDDDDVKDDEPDEHAEYREVMEERRHYDDVAS